MNTADLIAIIGGAGAIVPLVVALIQRTHWSSKAKGTCAIAVSIVGGLAAYVKLNGLPDWSNTGAVVGFVLGVGFAGQVAYKAFWKPTTITDALERLGSKDPGPGAMGINIGQVPTADDMIHATELDTTEAVPSDGEEDDPDFTYEGDGTVPAAA